MRLGLHRHLVAKGAGDGFFGAQVGNALIAIDQDMVAVQRLAGDAGGVDHQRNRQRPRHDCGVTADRAFLQHHPAQALAIFQKLAGADVARHQHRIFRQRRPGIDPLPGQNAQQAVRQIVKVMQALAQVGIGHLFQPGAGGGLFLFHRRLGRQAKGDVFLHPA